MEVLGIDIDNGSIKGAIVNIETGEIVSGKKSLDVIEDTRPHKLISKLHKMVKKFEWKGPIGCAFPAATHKGRILSTDRVNEAWIDADAAHLFSEITGCRVTVLSTADAAGIAEMKFGIGKKRTGSIIVLSVGPSIGSSLFIDGILVPNTELGQIEIKGVTVQDRASSKIRKEEGISRKVWAKRIQYVLEHFEKLFHPDMFILGGQVSKKPEKTIPYLKINTRLKPAEFGSNASIVGAAYFAALKQKVDKETPST